MLPRILEPEVMDTPGDAIDYDAMDHAHVNRVFVDDLLATWSRSIPPSTGTWTIFDAGTGTAQIPIELLRRGIASHVTAADAAEEMLKLARNNVSAAGFAEHIDCVHRDCKRLPESDGAFDVVMSNSIVHHIPEPQAVLDECWRILKPGGLLFVRDLLRPVNEATRQHLVAIYVGDANPHQRQLFADSLHAALTVDEVRTLVKPWGLPATSVQATSDRHWTLAAIK